MNDLPTPRPLIVIILDGWGISSIISGNAVASANTPNIDMFARHYPAASILAGSIEVGLPWGEVGNSETGHSNIGAGQVRYQSLPMINKSIEDKTFFHNESLLRSLNRAKQHRSQVHVMGLASPGGIHSHINHLFALLELLKKQGWQEHIFLHLFTDGRDTPPQSAQTYLARLEENMGKYGIGKIASVTGRFYAMDRNQNWSRTEATFNMLTGGARTSGASSASQAISQAYQQNIFDEMIPPTAITSGGGPIATIKDNDTVIFFNFRPDRARQLTRAFVETDFTGFKRTLPKNLSFVTMAQYDPNLPVEVMFSEQPVEFPLARIISDENLRQLHIAETEKYAHITYYLNGGHEKPFRNEDHVLIKSSAAKSFATTPHMAAKQITDRIIKEIDNNTYHIYFVNFANADMVGHTGDFEATKLACAFLDVCLGRLYQSIMATNGAMLITADHGNAEELLHPQTGEVETDHTSNPVPLYYINQTLQRTTPKSDVELSTMYSSPIGVLADIAPTILDILNIAKPSTMTGISLLASLQ